MKKESARTHSVPNHMHKLLRTDQAISVLLPLALCALLAGAASTSMGAVIPKAFAAGCNLFANELDAFPNNNIANVLPAPPNQTTVFKFISPNSGFEVETFDAVIGAWDPGTMVLNPGDGAILQTPVAFAAVFVGAPLAGPLGCKCMTKGHPYLLGRRTAGVGPSTYEDFAGVPPVAGATLFQFLPGPGSDCGVYAPPNYLIHTFVGGAWVPGPPLVPVAEAVWIQIPDVPPTITVGAGSISWTGCWRLESTPALGGPWRRVPGAKSPFALPVAAAGRFYRLVCAID